MPTIAAVGRRGPDARVEARRADRCVARVAVRTGEHNRDTDYIEEARRRNCVGARSRW